jgi:ceramide kinase
VNPYGGKQNALDLYEKYAKPIFRIANIDVSVIITQRPNQIFDLVLQQNLEPFDAIITCGGDGTFSELFNGLIYKDILKTNPDNPLMIDTNSIPKPSKTLGIIPAGSTDSIAYCLHGTSDIKTCIIHIVLGQTSGMDISSVSNDRGILRFCASAMSYGYLGDVLFDSENHRWLGPRRYEYSGFKKILLNRPYDVELMIQQEPKAKVSDVIIDCDEYQKLKCCENCSKCLMTKQNTKVEEEEEEEQYLKVNGKMFMIIGANISCACTRSPSGLSPYLHVGDGYIDVIVFRHGSVFNILKFLLTVSKEDGDISKLPFVEVHRTKKFQMRALNCSSLRNTSNSTLPITNIPSKHSSVWNCDGEILQESEITVR